MDFDTNLTESIKSISISGSHLMVAGDHVYNHYVDCRDANYFLSEDSIYDVLALPGEKVSNYQKITFYSPLYYYRFPKENWLEIWVPFTGKTSNSCIGLSGSHIESVTRFCTTV